MVFSDCAKTFNLLNRDSLIEKLERATDPDHPWTTLLRNILIYSYICINDNLRTSKDIRTNGMLQGLHINGKAVAAIPAMHDINSIHFLSTETAVALFKMKVQPIMIGPHLGFFKY
jgi:hypothetical protein